MRQGKIFEKLLNKQISQVVASKILKLSTRQVRNKFVKYQKHGLQSLIHGNRGKASTKKCDSKQLTFMFDLLKNEWQGFGPTFTVEKLNELYNIKISAEAARQAMIKACIWIPKQRKSIKRKRRERRPLFGELIQLDGSPHDWFEGRGHKCTLLVFVDDATSAIVWLEFVRSESVEDVMTATKHYFNKYGTPISFYVDHGSVFSVNLNNKDKYKKTQFERAMKELDVEIIHARSPQAKGRVERANRTMQDRLIKEMRLGGISTMEQANQFVQSGYLKKHNQQFAIKAQQYGDAHQSIEQYNLNKILCIKDTRKIQKDMVISYKNQILQLHKKQPAIIRPKDTVTIYDQFNGKISLSIRGFYLSFEKIDKRREKPSVEKVYNQKPRHIHSNSRLWVRGGFQKRSDYILVIL